MPKVMTVGTPREKKMSAPQIDAVLPLMLNARQVQFQTGLSRSSLYSKLDSSSKYHDPAFPRQFKIGLGSVRWHRDEILKWIADCCGTRNT